MVDLVVEPSSLSHSPRWCAELGRRLNLDNVITSMILMMIMILMKVMRSGDELGTIEDPLHQGKEETKTMMVLEE